MLGWEKTDIIIDDTETCQAMDLMFVADSTYAEMNVHRTQNYSISYLGNIISFLFVYCFSDQWQTQSSP